MVRRMSPRVVRHARLIVSLSNASASIRKSTLQTASKDLVLALVECARNVILGNVRLTPAQLVAIRRHKRGIEALVKPKTTLARRRRILQEGGFLGVLIKPLISVLGGILGGLGGTRG